MYKKITFSILICSLLWCACKKQDAFGPQKFGIMNLTNSTTANPLLISYNDVNRVGDGVDYNNIRIPVGKGRLKFKDKAGSLLLDTLLSTEENSVRNFVLFQPSATSKTVLLENNQANEPKPDAGFVKIKMANLATQCFPNKVNITMRMTDYNYGDEVDMDMIKDVKPAFEGYGKYILFDPSISDGSIAFFVTNPLTNREVRAGGIDVNNYATGKYYNVLTLALVERQNNNGNMTGADGKKYTLEVKALFIN